MKVFKGLFLSIGAMKAGTSWLYEMLQDHPDLNTTPIKEVHYFWQKHGTFSLLSAEQRCGVAAYHLNGILRNRPPQDVRGLFAWFERYLSDPLDDAWFASLFPERATRKYCTEFSNMSAKLKPEAWTHIRAMAEQVRVVYSVRSPLPRMWSHARFHAQVVGKFDKLADWSAAEYERFLRESGCFQHGTYAETLQFLRSNFDAAEYLVIEYEKIKDDPLALLCGVEAFLDIGQQTYAPRDLKAVHNAARSLTIPRAFAQAALPPIERELEQLARQNFAVPGRWMEDLRAAQSLIR
jgi:hypothetical protein